MAASATNQFRSSLHGFNREDVVSFIESTALDNEKERRLLQDANARLQAALDEKTAALDGLTASADAYTALSEERDSLAEANQRLLAEVESLKAQLAAAPAAEAPQSVAAPVTALNAPIPPISELRPVAPTVSSKNYSELELAAYRRAEVTERLARERAAKIYEQVNSVFSGANDRLRSSETDLESLSGTLQLNIDQLQQILYAIRCAYTETEESLKAVGEKNQEYAEADT